ncbi:hypothetical protein DW083_03795 [Parabacteroides sp. AF48-14]|uniref:hypothetical protein n=1 Tax=Parabacteroides sp. AF48-14 TaxID=2292052 RepID=UPI000F00E6B6|nr:hypothetical protein [Parabacteroides sp. AF48-14]RHO74199.1 hypothetical protein DW083_03795 [Parabacteroides sp. AF48-14]
MSNWEKQQEEKQSGKEKDKVRREKLAGYFFDLSKLTFASLVLGGIAPLYANILNEVDWVTILLGVFSSYIFAFFANRILKQ